MGVSPEALLGLPRDAGAENPDFRELVHPDDKRAYLDTMKAIMGWSVADRIDGITTPTLVVASDFDYTPVAFKEAFVARMHHAKLTVIPNAHHAVPIERPAVFNAVVASFLETQR